VTEAYDGREVVGMDLHRRRSVLVRMTADGGKLETARITNSPAELRRQIARARGRETAGGCRAARAGPPHFLRPGSSPVRAGLCQRTS